MFATAQANGIFEQPAAIGVERDTRLGEAFVQRQHCLHFFFAPQHAAFELEVLKAITGLRCFGEPNNGCRIQGFFVAQPQPVVLGVGL